MTRQFLTLDDVAEDRRSPGTGLGATETERLRGGSLTRELPRLCVILPDLGTAL